MRWRLTRAALAFLGLACGCNNRRPAPAHAEPAQSAHPKPARAVPLPDLVGPTVLGDGRCPPHPALAPQANRGWIASDCRVIKKVYSALPPPADRKAFLERLPRAVRDEPPVRLGFGLQRERLSLPGGDLGCDLTLVSYNGRITHLDVSIDAYDWHLIAPALRPALGPRVSVRLGGKDHADASLHYVRPHEWKKAKARLAAELGPASSARGTPAELSAFRTLTSPLVGLDVGSRCYYAGILPPGRVAMDQLVGGQRKDLLESALRGPSPEGRAYAALGLEQLHALSAGDRAVIRKLAAMPTNISTCNGCIVSPESSREFFGSKLFSSPSR